MNSIFFVDEERYRQGVEKIVSDAHEQYEKICYISFNDPHHIVVKMLTQVLPDSEKFIVVDASKTRKDVHEVEKGTFLVDTANIFNVYVFLKDLIMKEEVDALFLDSASALIVKHNHLPLKEMMETMLLDVGAHGCDTMTLAFKEHSGHEVLQHISTLMGRSMFI
ncbi:hypothetical protein J4212_01675 [Candidatus Woesearchaeota archaeon]|nr:hypothetical protein [Candidatus Woesearchaeota archaeon]